MVSDQQTWTNWAGNQHFQPERIVDARTEAELQLVVQDAGSRRSTVRVAGAGHSFTPVVQTSGTLVNMVGLVGLLAVDRDHARARVYAGTSLSDIGAPLWDAGFAIANQGDLDRQSLAGAVSTGTKGSGTKLGTMSSTITGVTLITGSGELLEIDDGTPDLLHAAQVSLGLLGPLTQIELAVVPRYYLRESNSVMSLDEILEKWDDLKAKYRHFSFWWMPTDRSSKVYELPDVPADHAFVKLLEEEEAPDDLTMAGEEGSRVGRAHLIYPDLALPSAPSYELEYVAPASEDKNSFLALRDLMMNRYPEQASPIQIRWQAADRGWLSPQYERDSASVSVSGIPGTVWEPFLYDVDQLLEQFDARPHWGKMHYLTPERVRSAYPKFESFNEVRRQLDPNGTFLNDQFTRLFV